MRPVLRPRHALDEIAGHLAVEPPSAAASTVTTGLSLNTERVEPGDLFLALPGTRAHGADFADAAVAAGAVAVLTDPAGAPGVDAVPILVVDNPRAELAGLSAWFYDHPSEAFRTVGITGTQGKTTTTYLA